jgi:HSP20 family protein
MFIQEMTTPWDSWRQLDQVQDTMTQALWGERSGGASLYPALNAWTNEHEAIVTAEIPGIDPATLDISVVGDTLTIKGSREPDQPIQGAKVLRAERVHGGFSRSLQLPFHVNAEKVAASARNGVLKITLPFVEAEKPRKITPKSE